MARWLHQGGHAQALRAYSMNIRKVAPWGMKPPYRAMPLGGHAEQRTPWWMRLPRRSGVRGLGSRTIWSGWTARDPRAAHEFRQQLRRRSESSGRFRVAILAGLACRVSMILADSAAQLAGSSPAVRRLNSAAARAG